MSKSSGNKQHSKKKDLASFAPKKTQILFLLHFWEGWPAWCF
jgi:hypothetical protein